MVGVKVCSIIGNAGEHQPVLNFDGRDGKFLERQRAAFADERFENRNRFGVAGVVKNNFRCFTRERTALLDDSLGERMADAIEIGILDVFARPIRAGVDVFARKRILFKDERAPIVSEIGVVAKKVTGQHPEPVFKAIQVFAAFTILEFEFFVNLRVKVFEQLLPRHAHLFVNVRF